MSQQVIWPQQNLARALANAAQRWSTHEALVISGRRMTYPALWQSVQQVGAALKACGVRRGDHVAVCMGNSIEWVVFFYAAATVGAVTVPVNTRFKSAEIAFCLKQADCKLLVYAERFLDIDFGAMVREAGFGNAVRLQELPQGPYQS